MAILGGISAYSFWVIGRICSQTGQSTYAGAFGQVFGRNRVWIVSASIIVNCLAVCMIFCIIIADNSRRVALAAGLSGLMANRAVLLSLIALLLLLPLSLLHSLAALAPFSALGVMGVCFTAAFCVLRFGQGAYEPDGQFIDVAPAPPSFGKVGTRTLPAFMLTSMLATSFMGHFSAPRFFCELERPTVQRFAVLTAYGFGAAFLIMGLLMTFGFLTFGGSCEGLILNNYAVTDNLAIASRVGVLASIICSFPILLSACRDDLLHLTLKSRPTTAQRTAATVAIVFVSAAVGASFDDLGFLVAFGGAVLATALVYVFPSAMLIAALRPIVRSGKASSGEQLEYGLNLGLCVMGIALAGLGAVVTVLKSFFPELFV